MNAAAILNANPGVAVQNRVIDPDAPVRVDYLNPAQKTCTLGGNWAKRLLDTDMDVGAMRPWVGGGGRTYITRQALAVDPKTGKQIVVNRKVLTNDTTATLSYQDWLEIDNTVEDAFKPRLRAAGDLRAQGLVYNLPNGIAKTMMQFQRVSDITGATVSMSGLRRSESDRPVFDTFNFPLPLIHKDFQFDLRQLLASRTGNAPLDLTTARKAARRVAEQVEQFTLGVANNRDLEGISQYTYNSSTIYGYLNYPGRLTKLITLPTAGGWTPTTTTNEVLAMRLLLQQGGNMGPYMVYMGQAWDLYLDRDYTGTYGDMTLRRRLREVDAILDVRTVDYIPDYSIVMVNMEEDTIRLVIGQDIITVQWESEGGWMVNFKVLCLILPQIRGDFYGNVGICHGNG